MRRFLIRLVINAVALAAAIFILQPHIAIVGNPVLTIIILALIFGVINAIIKPILSLLSCGLIILTLGLATLIINTLMFLLTGWIGKQFGYGFTVENFWYALLGAIIVSIVSFILSHLLRDKRIPVVKKNQS
jgi:putative membrane protein